jgi:hypothetical protein
LGTGRMQEALSGEMRVLDDVEFDDDAQHLQKLGESRRRCHGKEPVFYETNFSINIAKYTFKLLSPLQTLQLLCSALIL